MGEQIIRAEGAADVWVGGDKKCNWHEYKSALWVLMSTYMRLVDWTETLTEK